MRTCIAVVLLAACSGGDSDKDSSDSGSDTDTETHPLVPEGYEWLWNTEGCTTNDGGDGAQVYYLATGGRSESDGSFEITERWYWFFPEEGWDADCVDTWTVSGDFTQFDYAQLTCGQCEEAYDFTRTLTESSCGIGYHKIFDLEDPPDEQVYQGIVLLDTRSPSGVPYDDDKMLVVMGNHVGGSSYAVDTNYATGHAFYDDGEARPGSYDWLGDACIGIGG